MLTLLCCCRPWLLCRGTVLVQWLSRCLTARTSWIWNQAWGCGICLRLVCRYSGARSCKQFHCRHKHWESINFMSAFITGATCLHFTYFNRAQMMIYTAGQLPYSFNWLGNCVFIHQLKYLLSWCRRPVWWSSKDGWSTPVHSLWPVTDLVLSATHLLCFSIWKCPRLRF